MTVLLGKSVADSIYEDINSGIFMNLQKGWQDRTPSLRIITVGEDPASQSYVNMKIKRALELDYDVDQLKYDEYLTQDDLVEIIEEFNDNGYVDGIIVQLPLPKHIDEEVIKLAVSPDKDVDGFHPMTKFKSCTPLGVMKMLEHYETPIEGKNALVIGRSNIVGKPMAQYLVDANATVTIAHSRTPEQELIKYIENSDIVVVAVGIPEFIKNLEPFKFGATIIDVGIHRREDGSLCGDVLKNAHELRPDLNISPVPAGVGPLTVASLMYNTYMSWATKEIKDGKIIK